MTGRTQPLGRVPGLLELAEAQLGIVGRRQLLDRGVTRNHVRSQLRAQRWQLVGRHVVALMTGPLDEEQWRWVAVLHTAPDGCLDGLSALATHGLTGWPAPSPSVLLPHGRRTAAWEAIVVRHSRDIPDSDICERRGLRCTTVERSTLDAASHAASPRVAAGLVLAVVQQRLTSAESLAARIDREVTPRRHIEAMRQAVDSAADGADSLAENDVVDLLHRAGLARIRRQSVVSTPRGRRRVDLLVELPDGSLLAVEVDGPHHADPEVRRLDAEKDAALLAAGIRVLRIPVQWLRTDPQGLLAHLRRIAAGSTNGEQSARSHYQREAAQRW